MYKMQNASAAPAGYASRRSSLSFSASVEGKSHLDVSEEDRLFPEASRSWWRRSTPAILSFMSFARDSCNASSISFFDQI